MEGSGTWRVTGGDDPVADAIVCRLYVGAEWEGAWGIDLKESAIGLVIHAKARRGELAAIRE